MPPPILLKKICPFSSIGFLELTCTYELLNHIQCMWIHNKDTIVHFNGLDGTRCTMTFMSRTSTYVGHASGINTRTYIEYVKDKYIVLWFHKSHLVLFPPPNDISIPFPDGGIVLQPHHHSPPTHKCSPRIRIAVFRIALSMILIHATLYSLCIYVYTYIYIGH
jgi:hypothetical protein